LKLHRDASHDANGEVDPEDAPPEARRRVIALIAFANREDLEDEDEEREAHRELGKQVVVGDGESELKPIPCKRIHRSRLSFLLSAENTVRDCCPTILYAAASLLEERKRYSHL